MAYMTMSNWTTTEWNDELEAIARDKYVPMIMAMGADAVKMVRTGEYTFTVMTHYKDEATATAAAEKIAAIRAEAADELPMSMETSSAGPVFAGS